MVICCNHLCLQKREAIAPARADGAAFGYFLRRSEVLRRIDRTWSAFPAWCRLRLRPKLVIGTCNRDQVDMTEHKYGRGKFDAHPDYIKYMEEIVSHPNYHGMPNAKSQEGRIYWQVSSGKSTSFYKDYLARWAWWDQKATSLGIPGNGGENDRFTIAARKIQPTGYRVCRLCGNRVNVGYFYANHILTQNISKAFPGSSIQKLEPISQVISKLEALDKTNAHIYLEALFPERAEYFGSLGLTVRAFEASKHLRTNWLSPGFMGNPPDRLDGFHDYCTFCRKQGDPGRSDANMRTYNHDRRSFEWWAEGDWYIADALYNSAGPGACAMSGCKETNLEKVSPDHVGPLACGFKQLPLFLPTCNAHNSAKNRRFTLSDVNVLLEYERNTGESVASWQVRAHWNKYKLLVTDDTQTKALSNSLRSLQDMYLRVLWLLHDAGYSRFLATLLHPEYAFRRVEFIDLDPGKLTFSKIITSEKRSNLRSSLAARTIAIAFESLSEYAKKPIESRKMVRSDFDTNQQLITSAMGRLKGFLSDSADPEWTDATDPALERSVRVARITALLDGGTVAAKDVDRQARLVVSEVFDAIGNSAEIDFSRYASIPEIES